MTLPILDDRSYILNDIVGIAVTHVIELPHFALLSINMDIISLELYSRFMSKPFIPFSWLPASWGLRGDAFEEAKANYELEGYALDVKLAEIRLSGVELQRRLAEINFAHGIITEYERLKQLLTVDLDGVELQVELIKLDMEFGKIPKREGEKTIAGILDEPWVSIIDEGLDLTDGPNGFYFVFDWNEQWIELLRQHGYEGPSDEEMMERWFTDVCRNEVIQAAPVPFNSSIVYD